MPDVVIRAEHIAKRYSIGRPQESYRTLRDALAGAALRPLRAFRSRSRETVAGRRREEDESVWVLKGISFEVRRGEVIGLIGRNGAGKSTLLKILSRITEPTEGRARITGRVGSLLEVGTGFHSELTGRENVYLNGAILGMRKAEIDRKFDEIVAFAEVERFIDTPVKHYSSGMYLRLAFAVAAHLESEVLLVDEVLAVGDAAFQRKCLRLMDDVAKAGRTILLVSHDMGAIESLCRSALLLDGGSLAAAGETRAVIDAYLSSVQSQSASDLARRKDRQGDGKLRFTDLRVLKKDGRTTDVIQCGQDVEFALSYDKDRLARGSISIYIGVFTLSGQYMLLLGNEMTGTDFDEVPDGGQFSCLIERFPLLPGHYSVTLFCTVNGVVADWVTQAAELTVEGGDFYGTGRLAPRGTGGVLIPHRWRVAG